MATPTVGLGFDLVQTNLLKVGYTWFSSILREELGLLLVQRQPSDASDRNLNIRLIATFEVVQSQG